MVRNVKRDEMVDFLVDEDTDGGASVLKYASGRTAL